jgi:hypothetical protein
MKLNAHSQLSLVFVRSPSAKLQAVTPCDLNCLISMHDEFCVCLHRQALAPKGAKGAPPPPQEEGPRTILKMTQKFGHNPEVPPEQDVAKRVFDIANGHIRLAHTLISTPPPLHPAEAAKVDLRGTKQCSSARRCMCISCVSLILHLSWSVPVNDAHWSIHSARTSGHSRLHQSCQMQHT